MGTPSSRIACGNIATLSIDRVVVGRPHHALSTARLLLDSISNILINNVLTSLSWSSRAVAGGLLSSGRLSQRSSERS
jgi:hypothetical protein